MQQMRAGVVDGRRGCCVEIGELQKLNYRVYCECSCKTLVQLSDEMGNKRLCGVYSVFWTGGCMDH